MSKPVAWIFELAIYRNVGTGEYSNWKEYVQIQRPNVPAEAIRNLRPLYAGSVVEYELDPVEAQENNLEKMGIPT